MARPGPAGPGPGGRAIVSPSHEEASAFLASLVPSRWLQIFSAEAPQHLDAQVIGRLDTELGPLWPPAQADVLTDLFLTGARFLTP